MQRRYWGRLARVIGPDAMTALIRAYPGRRLFVPRNTDRASRFTMLDAPTVERLCAEFGSTSISIPAGNPRLPRIRTGKPEVRVADVVNLTAKGMKAWEIARKLKCSVRTVHEKRAENRAAGVVAFPILPE